MQVGWITQEGFEHFRSLLLPETVASLEEGSPLLTLGLMEGETACGALAAWLSGETLELRSLYVAPDYRRRGGGRALVETLLRLLEKDCAQVSVCYTATQPDHDTLAPFLTAMGFRAEPHGAELYRVTVGELDETPFFSGKEGGGSITPFEQVPPGALQRAYKGAAARGENYLEYPLTDPRVDARVSAARLEGSEVRSFAVVTVSGPGRLALSWVKSEVPQDIPPMLRFAFARLRQLYAPDTTLTIQTVNRASAALVAAILPQARPISRRYARTLP